MNMILMIAAAVLFTVGGLCMKQSEGLTRVWPTVLLGVLFLAGAASQALAMRREEMSVAYVFVLGLESVLACVFGVVFFGEAVTVGRVCAVGLITAGIVLLRG